LEYSSFQNPSLLKGLQKNLDGNDFPNKKKKYFMQYKIMYLENVNWIESLVMLMINSMHNLGRRPNEQNNSDKLGPSSKYIDVKVKWIMI